jgi:hypothetical protein
MDFNRKILSIQACHMVFGSPFYKALKTGVTRKFHNGEGGLNGDFSWIEVIQKGFLLWIIYYYIIMELYIYIYIENPIFISFLVFFISHFQRLKGFEGVFKGIFNFLFEFVLKLQFNDLYDHNITYGSVLDVGELSLLEFDTLPFPNCIKNAPS